jgi:hypothetical protein
VKLGTDRRTPAASHRACASPSALRAPLRWAPREAAWSRRIVITSSRSASAAAARSNAPRRCSASPVAARAAASAPRAPCSCSETLDRSSLTARCALVMRSDCAASRCSCKKIRPLSWRRLHVPVQQAQRGSDVTQLVCVTSTCQMNEAFCTSSSRRVLHATNPQPSTQQHPDTTNNCRLPQQGCSGKLEQTHQL